MSAIEAICSELNEREIGNLLHSLAKINVPWSSLPATVQNGLMETMVRNSKGLRSKQGSMAVYALGCLGANIDYFTPAWRDNLFAIAQTLFRERYEPFRITQQA